MIRNLTEWDKDDKGDAEDEYEALRRSLSWTEGFGLLFVDCTPATAEKLIEDAKQDLRGNALFNLGRFEEAIASYDNALQFKPDKDEAWYKRGFALDELGRFEEAIASYDNALQIKPDKDEAWNNRGNVLSNLGRFEEAIISYNKALEIKPDDANAFYGKACCYALQNQIDLALENLQQAITLNPDEYREMAKTNSDFDSIRQDPRFQALIQ